MTSAGMRVLVVDDAVDYARMVAEFIRADTGSAVVDIADSYQAAVRAFDSGTYDVAFFDYWLGSQDGLSLLREIRGRGLDTPVIVMTGRGAEEVAVDAMKAGASDYLPKADVTPDAVSAAIRHALALRNEERQRRQAEAALIESEERFRALVENSSDALLLVDAEARFTYVTPSSERHLGWQPRDLVGRSAFEFVHPDDHEFVSARMAEVLQRPGEPVMAEVRFRHGDGSWRNMETVGVNRLDEPSVRAIVINVRDVTERRGLEDQLRQAQKMEAIGRLAGGIAHDFSNLLTAILGYCDLVLDQVGPGSPLQSDLAEIRSAGHRAAVMTRRLLAFSRRQMLLPQVMTLNGLIRQMEKPLRRLMGGDIAVVTRLARDLMAVRVDPSSIEQVLLNLALNARDAMPRGGRLIIETANVEVDAVSRDPQVPMPPGHYVSLTVSDGGVGMDAATRSRVFEPFFTTKQQGKGIGLGLATVYGIVKQSGGYISVETEVAQGTVFTIYFPPVASVTALSATEGEGDQRRGAETVLLVAHEDALRALVREVLRRHGYVVLEARHGLDALRLAERHSDEIHLLVVDGDLPHMSGRDLADRLSSGRSNLKVLFVPKPFIPASFARKVRRVLDAKRESGVMS